MTFSKQIIILKKNSNIFEGWYIKNNYNLIMMPGCSNNVLLIAQLMGGWELVSLIQDNKNNVIEPEYFSDRKIDEKIFVFGFYWKNFFKHNQ